MMTIPPALERLAYRYPSVLVDAVTRHEPGRRMTAVKNVTDREYVDIRDYPTPGREWSFTVGLRRPGPENGALRAREER